eukprot:1160863-Pelagomonas_calceolata.AAC.1
MQRLLLGEDPSDPHSTSRQASHHTCSPVFPAGCRQPLHPHTPSSGQGVPGFNFAYLGEVVALRQLVKLHHSNLRQLLPRLVCSLLSLLFCSALSCLSCSALPCLAFGLNGQLLPHS